MSQYLVKTPSPEFSGVTYGVQFREGEAFVNQHTISKHLGWTVQQVVDGMKRDFGYEVEELSVAGEVIPQPKKKRGKRSAKSAGAIEDGKEKDS